MDVFTFDTDRISPDQGKQLAQREAFPPPSSSPGLGEILYLGSHRAHYSWQPVARSEVSLPQAMFPSYHNLNDLGWVLIQVQNGWL